MELQPESLDRPLAASLKATYRALLARGLEAGEAANLTGFLHGLPSAGFRWTLPEIESIIQRRIAHAAELRAEANAVAIPAATTTRPRRPSAALRRHSSALRRQSRSGSTHVIDPPRP